MGTIHKSGFTKLVHEIIPIEKLCPICNYFIFGEQKCERKNCEKGICYSCYQKVPQCEFCKLLHRGTPVVVKQKNLSKFTEIKLLAMKLHYLMTMNGKKRKIVRFG